MPDDHNPTSNPSESGTFPRHRPSSPRRCPEASEIIPARGLVSCERCKRRKSRCDRRYPICGRCETAQVSCEYVDRRKPGFPTGHRQVLESKIKTLEAEIQRLRERDGPTTVNERAAPILANHHVSAALGTSPADDEQSRHQDPPVATSARTAKITERKPPSDLVFSLASLFFRHIHPWLPFLDVQGLFDEMTSIDEPHLLHYALFGISLPYSSDSRLDRNSSDSFWKYSKRRIFVEILEEPSFASLEAMTILILDISGMTNGPQIWGPLAVATGLAIQLRTVDGRLLRRSTEDVENDLPCSPDQIPRMKLFWAIYALDCYITITTSHPSRLTGFHLQHFLPARQAVRSEQGDNRLLNYGQHISRPPNEKQVGSMPATPISVFKRHLELLDISRDVQTIYIQYIAASGKDELHISCWAQTFMECSVKLTEWFQVLPWYLHLETSEQLQKQNPRALAPVVLLNAFYHALTIHFNGLVAFPQDQAVQHQLSEFCRDCQNNCIRSVQFIVDISPVAIDKAKDKLGWPFAWCLWVAARFLLVAKHRGFVQPSQSLEILKQHLKSMGRFWQISWKYWHLINKAEAELRHGFRSGSITQSNVPGSIFDLRTSTSDLEDELRIDPFLIGAAATGEEASLAHQVVLDDGAHSRARDLDPTLHNTFNRQSAGDDWFSIPLFAFSAYEQLPQDFSGR